MKKNCPTTTSSLLETSLWRGSAMQRGAAGTSGGGGQLVGDADAPALGHADDLGRLDRPAAASRDVELAARLLTVVPPTTIPVGHLLRGGVLQFRDVVSRHPIRVDVAARGEGAPTEQLFVVVQRHVILVRDPLVVLGDAITRLLPLALGEEVEEAGGAHEGVDAVVVRELRIGRPQRSTEDPGADEGPLGNLSVHLDHQQRAVEVAEEGGDRFRGSEDAVAVSFDRRGHAGLLEEEVG
jgi:hypothetical protein